MNQTGICKSVLLQDTFHHVRGVYIVPTFGKGLRNGREEVVGGGYRRGIVQHFNYVEPAMKSVAEPSIVTWKSPAKGTKGETVNATNNASRLIVNRNWKPLQS